MKRLSKGTRDSIKKPDGRQGTFARQFDEMMNINDRLSDAGHAFVASLHTMHDELQELAKKNEKARKSLKETSMRHEKCVVDAEQAAEKAKSKYNSLCDEMERLKDPNKTKFGFKSKNNPQHEQELQSKIASAENDYSQKVTGMQNLRKELMSQLRPQHIKMLKDLIQECDSGMSLQFQKYATLNETLALNGGFIVSPLKPSGSASGPPSLKEIVSKVDNDLDFYNDILKIPNTKKEMNRREVTFVQHPYMSGGNSFTPGLSLVPRPASVGTNSQFRSSSPAPVLLKETTPSFPSPTRGSGMVSPVSFSSQNYSEPDSRAYDYSNVNRELNSMSPPYSAKSGSIPLEAFHSSQSHSPVHGGVRYVMSSFGTSLDDIIEFEALPDPVPVPRVVSQCVSAIDQFGLDAEGIYRHSGNPSQIQVLKHLFDTDPNSVDLSQPARFGITDIHAVSGTLKLYFQELPDPLLTQEYHHEFIEAAKIDNDWKRRDAIHEVVNKLSDSNYTVLRYLMFHLDRVSRHEAINRMATINLGNMWGSVLMAADHDNITEMALQARVIETILYNCDHIFEAE